MLTIDKDIGERERGKNILGVEKQPKGMGHLLKILKVLVFCVPIFRTGVDRENGGTPLLPHQISVDNLCAMSMWLDLLFCG